MSFNDELPDGPQTLYAMALAFIAIAILMMIAVFFLTACSHSIQSRIGNEDQNVSLGFNVELKHKKEQNDN